MEYIPEICIADCSSKVA